MRRYPQPRAELHHPRLMRQRMPIAFAVFIALFTTFVFLRWTGLACAVFTAFHLLVVAVIAHGLGAPKRARKAKRDELMRAARERFGLP